MAATVEAICNSSKLKLACMSEAIESKISFAFCKEVLQASLIQPPWQSFKHKVLNHLEIYKGELQTFLEPQLADQVLLDLIGNDIRKLWGRQADYKPELLQEVLSLNSSFKVDSEWKDDLSPLIYSCS